MPASAERPSAGLAVEMPVDTRPKDIRRLEDQHASRFDRNLDAGLGISPNASALRAHEKGAKGGELHLFARGDPLRHFRQDELNDGSTFSSRQAKLLVDRLRKILPGACLA